MADLSRDTYGPGSMQQVNLLIVAFDSGVSRYKNGDKAGEINNHYLAAYVHPDDARGAGQEYPSLAMYDDPKAKGGKNYTIPYAPSQLEAISAAAGDNVTDYVTTDGKTVGKIYGVKADVFTSKHKTASMENGAPVLKFDTTTLNPSDFSVGPTADGKSVLDRTFSQAAEARAEKKAAREAAKEEATAEPKTAEKATAAKKTTKAKAAEKAPAEKKARAPRKPRPSVAEAETETQASVDEPSLG